MGILDLARVTATQHLWGVMHQSELDNDFLGRQPEARGKKKPPKGHGRNGADEYTEAEQEFIKHDHLQVGDSCPECGDGTLNELPPTVVVRISGQLPIRAKVYRMQRLRCKGCDALSHNSRRAL